MKRQGRGTVEEKVKSVEGVEIIALKWYDNKPMHFVSLLPCLAQETYRGE